jgi:hypothetical protein
VSAHAIGAIERGPCSPSRTSPEDRKAPRDQLVRVRAAAFAVDDGARIRVGCDWYRPTDHALGQIAERAGIPLPYLRQLTAPAAAPWQHALAADILTEHHSHAEDTRVLARSVGGTLRGWQR